MRRQAAALSAIAVLTAALLTGCGTDAGDDPTPADDGTQTTGSGGTQADLTALGAVTVEGPDEAPTLSFVPPFDVSAPVALVETEGTGEETLAAGDLVSVQYAIYSGDDGSVITDTWADGRGDVIPMSGLGEMFDPLVDSLVGHQVGTRVLLGLPGSADGTDASAASAVWLVQATAIVPLRAVGTPVEPAEGLPVVTLAEDGAPSIEVPADFAAPPELVAQTLIEGDGPVVETGQYLNVQYSGWLTDGTQFDSSWTGGTPFGTQIGVGSVITGWDEGLVGKTVGSQVLLVIPAELGYGADGSGSIPPDSTLIFVVDILSAS